MSNLTGKPDSSESNDAKSAASWTFLTNHAHVLICIARNSEARIRDLALQVGITERAVQRIISELEDEGYLVREREGRRNVYRIAPEVALRHPIERHRNVGALLDLILRTHD